MNILIIGSGGREHALGWKLKQSPKVNKLFFAPGNGGTGELGENIDIKVDEIDKLISFVEKNDIALTIVGPEGPLSMGIVDLFKKKGLPIFGPSKRAAQLESSKTWATTFMEKYNIPHPLSYKFKEYKKALAFVASHDMRQYVIKVSGLALGKGVILPQTEKEAQDALESIMVKREFGNAGDELLIQERLSGPEVSLIALSDGSTIIPLLSTQDHKRAYDNDGGPNTGGMGAYGPVPFVTKKLLRQIQKTILQPTINGMRKEKIPYRGILFAGLMITKDGPKVLEYNVRFGDPETQPIMALLQSDLLSLIFSSIQGTLKTKKIRFYRQAAVCIVITSHGYPGKYDKGELIHGLSQKPKENVFIFHAGTVMKKKAILTDGGRVLGVTARAKSLVHALGKAYSYIGKNKIYFRGMHFRTDIGKKAITNTNSF